jgi:hypothetical protein
MRKSVKWIGVLQPLTPGLSSKDYIRYPILDCVLVQSEYSKPGLFDTPMRMYRRASQKSTVRHINHESKTDFTFVQFFIGFGNL